MAQEKQLDAIINLLVESKTSPLAVHVNGTVTYVVYPAQAINGTTGYPIKRITEPTASHSYFDASFLTEAARLADSNRNLKTDSAGTITLLGTLTFG